VIPLAVFLVFGIAPQAFADFSSDSAAAGTLGVGRIQSTADKASLATSGQDRFVLNDELVAADTSKVEQLAAPLACEITIPAQQTAVVSYASTDFKAWQSGRASAYGPGNAGSWTAGGTELTADSMGVAVDISWGYLIGRTIEISYNGNTLVTTIVDTGNCIAHGRTLDFQPGVWKAFGASSEREWGVRTVDWRLLD
jgi:hypothetical protein